MAQVDDEDAEALTWGTERDTTHVEAPGAPAEVEEAEEDEEEPEAASSGSALLVVYGIFAGIFLVYIVGWIIAIRSLDLSGGGPLAEVLDRIAQFLAFLSPALWFFGVLLLVPSDRARTRVLWLLLGIVVLAPWPFVLGF
jgi:hypothetical protein